VIINNSVTGQELNYYDGDYFFMRLVEGQYAIVGFETRMGIPLRSEDGGFKFTVRNGEITYIGSILGEEGLRTKLSLESSQTSNQYSTSKVFYAGRYAGGASMFIPRPNAAYNFYVVDDKEKPVKQFKSLFPNLNDVEIKTALMN